MVKPGSQRQREYLERLKEKNREEYLKKERTRKKEKLLLMKATNKGKFDEKLRKDRERKKLQRSIRRQQVIQLLISLQSDPEDFVFWIHLGNLYT